MVINRRTRHFLTKVLTSPRLFLNTSLVLFSYLFRRSVNYGRPIVVDLEPSNACNFRCPHCDITYSTLERKMLSRHQYDITMKSFPYVLRLKLQGAGEPFVNNLLHDFIWDACSRGVWCEVTTNGSILDMERLKPLKRLKTFRLVFSFDAADKETFEKIRKGSSFEKILENIDKATADSSIDVAAWMLIREDNKDQVKDVVSLLAEKGVKSLGLQGLFFDHNKETQNSKIRGGWVKHVFSKNHFASLRRHARQSGIQLSLSNTLYNRSHICPWPWMGVFVSVSGNIMPCCRMADDGVYNMGNLNKNDFGDIWNSGAYQEFRLRHKINDLPEVCRSCYSE